MKFDRSDSMLVVIRLLLIGLGAYAGNALARAMAMDGLNVFYISALGALIASLASAPARWLRAWLAGSAETLGGLPPRAVLAFTIALILALTVSVLLGFILTRVPGYAWYHQVFITLLLAWFLTYVGTRGQDVFTPFGRNQRKDQLGGTIKLLDTNIIIDGRILEVARTGFLEGELIVPGFVLRELQYFADQSDPTKRTKGKRGLDLLEQLAQLPTIRVTVREFEDTGGGVDDRLVRAAQSLEAVIVSNDNPLAKSAALQGVQTLSFNALADALKPRVNAGDELIVQVIKEGSQPGQGVAYLEDGTMVVIEDGMALKGRKVRVTIVSNIQTALGRMIFAKFREVV